MAETVKVLRRFHRATQQIVTDSVRVVATSALRDARNSQAFLEWVRSATGWRVEIISGVEEARLIHLGLVSGSRVDRAPTLMMDLGGGSCELTVTQGGHIRDAVSLPLGAVRLTNEFLRHDPARKGRTETAARLRYARSKSHRRPHCQRQSEECDRHLGYCGSAWRRSPATCVAEQVVSGPCVSRAEMTRIAKRLARLPVAERRKIEGIGPRRAEIIVAGATVYHELLERLDLKGFRYSPARPARRNPRADGRRLRSQHALGQADRIRTMGIDHERGRPLSRRPQARAGRPRRRHASCSLRCAPCIACRRNIANG